MIEYGALYQELCLADETRELELLPSTARPPHAQWSALWQRQHGLSPLDFQELLWRVRRAERVEQVVAATGTVHLALSLLEILDRHGIASICATGALQWLQPLFPPAGQAVSTVLAGLPGWLRELQPEAQYGQLQATAASSERRVAALIRDLPALGRSVLFLGDDDLTSLLLAGAICGDVTVADVDQRVLKLVARVAGDFGLGISTIAHDVRQPLPPELQQRYDSVHCDPVDDGIWLEWWLRAAVSALMPVPGARLFLSLSPRRIGSRYVGVHRFLQERGFVLEHRERNANQYPIADVQDAFYRSGDSRIASVPWAGAVEWALGTDLLVFRYEDRPGQLWPQQYRELRRAV